MFPFDLPQKQFQCDLMMMMESSSVSHSPLVTFEEGDESAGQQVPGRKSKQQPYDYEDLSKVFSLPCMRHTFGLFLGLWATTFSNCLFITKRKGNIHRNVPVVKGHHKRR
jgi:hypothetical protein